MHDGDRIWRERALRVAVLAGDECAWRTWYEESFDGFHQYVLWRCGGLRDLADEVVQETWLIAVRRIRGFDPERGSFAGWLRGIAANVLRNQLRQRKRRPVESLNGRDANIPAAQLREPDIAERIARALAALPEDYESALKAKYVDRWSVKEIAEHWNDSAKAVESLLTRAREAFRKAYMRAE